MRNRSRRAAELQHPAKHFDRAGIRKGDSLCLAEQRRAARGLSERSGVVEVAIPPADRRYKFDINSEIECAGRLIDETPLRRKLDLAGVIERVPRKRTRIAQREASQVAERSAGC